MNYVLLFRLTLVIEMKISYPTQGGVKLFSELQEKMKSMKNSKLNSNSVWQHKFACS